VTKQIDYKANPPIRNANPRGTPPGWKWGVDDDLLERKQEANQMGVKRANTNQ